MWLLQRPAGGEWSELFFMSRMEGLVKDAELLVHKDAQLWSQDLTSILGMAPRNSRAVAAGPPFTGSDGVTYVPIVGLCDIFRQNIVLKVDHGLVPQIPNSWPTDPGLMPNWSQTDRDAVPFERGDNPLHL